MPLLGRAAVLIWSHMADPAEHDHWHSHEHLPERAAIPGFLRSRRCVARDAAEPRYLVLYEVADAAVMTSPAYLERLNAPTAWSRRTMAANLALSRTLCSVVASHGRGVGAWVLAMPFLALEADPASIWEAGRLQALTQQPGLTGAHLLRRDASSMRPATEEERLRGKPDASIEAVLLLEGYDAHALAAAGSDLKAEARAHGLAPAGVRLYELAHLLAASPPGAASDDVAG